jgi:hypothetical protein
MMPTMKLGRWLTLSALAAALAAPGRPARAADYTWAGPGNIWSAAGNWMPNTGPPGTNANDTATIAKMPGVSLDVDETIAKLTMNSAGSSLSISNPRKLTVNGPITLTQGRLFLTGGSIAGTGTLTITNKSSVTAQGSSSIANPIDQGGTLTVQSSAGAPAALALAKDLTNNGTLQLINKPADKAATVDLSINGGKGTLTNNGSISFSQAGAATSISAALDNSIVGMVNVSGSATVGAANAKSANTGVITIGAGASLALVGASFTNNLNPVNAGNPGIIGAGTLDRSQIAAGGWMNNGIVAVGTEIPGPAQAQGLPAPQGAQALQPGLLSFVGDYVQSSTGTLAIPINQAGMPGVDYSQLAITQGAAVLDGTLAVTVNDPSLIKYGDTFTVLTSDSGLTGSFANAVPDSSGMATLVADGGTFTAEYLGSAGGPSAVVLTDFVAAVPEPPALHLLASGAVAAGLAAAVRLRRPRRGASRSEARGIPEREG